jgi:hypothetical protein
MAFYIDPRVSDRTVAFWVEKCWTLRAQCSACRRIGEMKAAELRRLPQDATIGAVVSRLKCEACGGAEGHVDWLQDRTATTQRDMAAYQERQDEAKSLRLDEDVREALMRYIAERPDLKSPQEAAQYLLRDALIGLGLIPLGERNRSKGAQRA